MAGSTKLFHFLQEYHQFIGFKLSESNQKKYSIGSRNVIFLTSLGQTAFTTFVFLMFKAESMFDYGFSYFMAITYTNGIAVYLLFMSELKNTRKFIKNCEGFIEKSTYEYEYGL